MANLRGLIESKEKTQQHLALFPEHHRDYLERQLNDLPILHLEVKMMVGKQQVQEFYTDDFPEIYFKVERKNETSGYCYLHRFPFLKEEKYYLMFVFGNNLIHFQEVTVFLFRSYSNKARTPLWENSLTDSRLPVK